MATKKQSAPRRPRTVDLDRAVRKKQTARDMRTQKIHDRAARDIHRLWGDLDVVDAERDLRVFMLPEDVAGAVRKDPAGCVFARACRRAFGSSKVLIYRTVAYVDLPDEDGHRHVERFLLSERMRDLVESFDRGEGIIPQGGFLLQKPSGSMQFGAKRARNRKFKDQRIRARLQGTAVVPDAKPSKRAPYRSGSLVLDLVRSGSGVVHFARRSAQPQEFLHDAATNRVE